MTEQNTVVGLLSATLATALYGSCYVPVRWFEAGDGMYFQWLDVHRPTDAERRSGVVVVLSRSLADATYIIRTIGSECGLLL
ncbi:hypothetical protein COOONC_20569 [Cooperia oncophora]